MVAPKTVSFSTGVTPYASEIQNATLDEALYRKLLQEQLSNTSSNLIDSGRIKTANLDGIGNALAAGRSQSLADDAAKRRADYQGKYQERLIQELRAYQQSQEPGTRELAGPMPEGEEQMTAPTPGNQRAFEGQLASVYPEMRAIAQADQKNYEERYKEAAKRASLDSQINSNGNITALVPKQEQVFSGGRVAALTEGQAPQLLAGRSEPGRLANGSEIDINSFTNERDMVDKAAKVTQTQTNQAPGNQILKGVIEGLPKKLEQAQIVATNMRNVETGLNALAEGARTGYGEDWLQNARTLISGITGAQFDASTPTGTLAKVLAKNTIAELGGLGNQVSNTDREFMAMAEGGTATDPAALERILAIKAAELQRRLDAHNKQVGMVADDPKNEAGAYTREAYTVQQPKTMYRLQSPEALASFVSISQNIPYEEALKIARDPQNAPTPSENASGAVKTSMGVNERAAKEARIKELRQQLKMKPGERAGK